MKVLALSRTQRIDWVRMRSNLRQLGMSDSAVAHALGVHDKSVRYWGAPGATGEPAFWTGAAFIELWCDRTGLRWTDLPIRHVDASVADVLRASR